MEERWRRSAGGRRAAVVALLLAMALPDARAEETKKPAKPPTKVEITGAAMQVSIPIKSNATVVSDEEFERAVTETPAAEEAKQRMAAVLAGEKATHEAEKLRGQARLDALEKAARDGDPAAAETLGDMLDTGDGVRADPARAMGYYHAAALGGRMEAAHSLAVAYTKGRGVRRDYTEALAWMIVARQRGDDSGVEDQLRDYLTRRGDETTPADAERRAAGLAAKAAREQIVAVLPAEAALEYDDALAEGATGATFDAAGGGLRESGAAGESADGAPPVVVITVFGERLSWPTPAALEQAANRGEPAALTALGRLLTNGKLPADPMRAVLLLEQAAAKGEIDAAHQLGELYAKGEGLVHDDAKAFRYTMQAARGGSMVAMASAGVFYTNGRGTDRDLVRGLAWLTVAKELGADLGQEKRLRAFLTQYRPQDVAAADELAKKLRAEIEVKKR